MKGGARPGAGRPKGPPYVSISFRAPEAWKGMLREGESLGLLALALLRAEMTARGAEQAPMEPEEPTAL